MIKAIKKVAVLSVAAGFITPVFALDFPTMGQLKGQIRKGEAGLSVPESKAVDDKNADTTMQTARAALAKAFYTAKPLTKEEFLAMSQDLYFETYCLNTTAQMGSRYEKSYKRGRVFIENNKLVFGAVRGESWSSIPSMVDDKGETVFYSETGLNSAELIVIRKTRESVFLKSFYSTGYENEEEKNNCFGILKPFASK